jgi:DNA-binding NarL/FixJ family response regulator
MTANSGRQALLRIEQQLPEVVLLDMVMSGSDGLDTFREIRRRWPNLLVILQTAWPDDALEARIKELSPAAAVEKSSPISVFIETIETVRQTAGIVLDQHARGMTPSRSVADRGSIGADENILQP